MTKGKTFHLRIRTREGSIVNVSQWAHDLWQARYLIQRLSRCEPSNNAEADNRMLLLGSVRETGGLS
jgi:hypothetical protein